jgi:hypothetical protein
LTSLVPEGSFPAAWQVFLSSTIGDFEEYRRAVQDVLLRKAEAAVHLSEDWPGGYDLILDKCQSRIEGSNGFLLMLGYWYGSVPQGSLKSITHLEFEWAAAKWGAIRFPPMAVFIPRERSPADRELRQRAEELVAEKQLDPQEQETLRAAFWDQVTKSWRAVQQFKDLQDLREYVLASCLLWKGRTPLAAARGEAAVASSASRLTDEQLGTLGRGPQLAAARRLLSLLEVASECPAVCLLVSGSEDAGQRAFVAALLNQKSFREQFRPAQLGRPAAERYDVELLSQWVARRVGLSSTADIESPAALAERVAEALREQPLCFALDQANRFPGGVAGFRTAFWQPFHDRLQELRAARVMAHPLVAVITEYSGDASNWGASVVTPEAAGELPDSSQIFLLPRLAEIERGDLLVWLAEIDVPRERRGAVAGSVLTNAQGHPDPIPLRIFDRLQREALWPRERNA